MLAFWDSVISWTICKQSAPRFRQITTPTPQHSMFTGRMLFPTHNQQCQSTEGKNYDSCQLDFSRAVKRMSVCEWIFIQQLFLKGQCFWIADTKIFWWTKTERKLAVQGSDGNQPEVEPSLEARNFWEQFSHVASCQQRRSAEMDLKQSIPTHTRLTSLCLGLPK